MRLDDWLAENFGGYGLEVTAAHLIRGVMGCDAVWAAPDIWNTQVEQKDRINRIIGARSDTSWLYCEHDFPLPAHHISVGTDLADALGRTVRVDVEFYMAYCAEAKILYWYQEGNSGN